MTPDTPVLEVEHLTKSFTLHRSIDDRLRGRDLMRVHAVTDVSFTVQTGETLGLVGESGCGKTTLAYMLVGLLPPSSGRIVFRGEDITRPGRERQKSLRRQIQIVFQDPFTSLDPRQRVIDVIREPLDIHSVGPASSRIARVRELMEMVRMPRRYELDYPHQLSGGLRQRVGIAAALALGPSLVVADEPTSALDTSVQAEILNLLEDIQHNTGVSFVLVSHNLDVVRHVSHRVAVMYLGKLVELGPVREVYASAHHPYTAGLLASVPKPDPRIQSKPLELTGEVPSPLDLPSGCPFHPRCPLREAICETVEPQFAEYERAHRASCHVTHREYAARQTQYSSSSDNLLGEGYG